MSLYGYRGRRFFGPGWHLDSNSLSLTIDTVCVISRDDCLVKYPKTLSYENQCLKNIPAPGPRHVLHTITRTLSLSAPIIHNALQCQRIRGKKTKFWWMLWKTCLGCAALPYRHCSDSLAALSIDGGGGVGWGWLLPGTAECTRSLPAAPTWVVLHRQGSAIPNTEPRWRGLKAEPDPINRSHPPKHKWNLSLNSEHVEDSLVVGVCMYELLSVFCVSSFAF